MNWPWSAGAATGIGSLPGTDIVDAVALVFGELPDLPFLPELPRRGPGAYELEGDAVVGSGDRPGGARQERFDESRTVVAPAPEQQH